MTDVNETKTVRVPRDLLDELVIWLEGALNCKEWRWDSDQKEAATGVVDATKKLLKNTDTAQEPSSALPVLASAVRRSLINKTAKPDHPSTALNPNGRDGFVITEVMVENNKLFVRGVDTMWFGENSIIEICDP